MNLARVPLQPCGHLPVLASSAWSAPSLHTGYTMPAAIPSEIPPPWLPHCTVHSTFFDVERVVGPRGVEAHALTGLSWVGPGPSVPVMEEEHPVTASVAEIEARPIANGFMQILETVVSPMGTWDQVRQMFIGTSFAPAFSGRLLPAQQSTFRGKHLRIIEDPGLPLMPFELSFSSRVGKKHIKSHL